MAKRRENTMIETKGADHDNAAHKSSIIEVGDISDFRIAMFHAKNDTHKDLTVQFEGSLTGLDADGVLSNTEFEKNLVELGSAVTVVAQADGTNNSCDVQTTSRRFPFYRCTYQFAVAPTEKPNKNLTMTFSAQ